MLQSDEIEIIPWVKMKQTQEGSHDSHEQEKDAIRAMTILLQHSLDFHEHEI